MIILPNDISDFEIKRMISKNEGNFVIGGDIGHMVSKSLRSGDLGGLRKDSAQKRGGIVTLDKKVSHL